MSVGTMDRSNVEPEIAPVPIETTPNAIMVMIGSNLQQEDRISLAQVNRRMRMVGEELLYTDIDMSSHNSYDGNRM
jgi:hypothetical protein